MTEQEERLRQYLRGVEAEAESVPDVRLDGAIRAGMAQGRQSRSGQRFRIGWMAAALAAAVLVMFLPSLRPGGGEQAAEHPAKAIVKQPASWGSLEVFRPEVEDNQTIRSALDAGRVLPLNESVSLGEDYKLTLNGAIADAKGITILYTFENFTGQRVNHYLSLEDRKGAAIASFSTGGQYTEDSGSPRITRDFTQIFYEKDRDTFDSLQAALTVMPDTPEAKLSSSTKYRKTLTVPFTLDRNKVLQGNRRFTLDRELVIAGQKVKVSEFYLGATGTYMTYSFDGKNSMKVFDFLNDRIVFDGSGEGQELYSHSAFTPRVGKITQIYPADSRFETGAFAFKADGILALNKDKLDVVVDLEKGKILKAPDDRLTLSPAMQDAQGNELIFRMFVPETEYQTMGGTLSLDDNYTDGERSGHWLSSGKSSEGVVTSGTDTAAEENGVKGYYREFHYYLERQDLPQPLTFKLTNYPSPLHDPQSLRIE